MKRLQLAKMVLLFITTFGLITPSYAGFFDSIANIFSGSSFSQADINALDPELQETAQTILRKARNLNPKVLALALRAYENTRKQGVNKRDVITIIDYSMPSTKPRLWVLDLQNKAVPFYTFVAHGSGSGDNYSEYFSNQSGSKASSLGVFVTGSTYMGGNGYSLNLYGLEKNINDRAFQRRVVIHGATYVNEQIVRAYGRLGRSWGCPAIAKELAPKVINYIKQGSVVFAYYPDRKWLKNSRYLREIG